MARSDHQVVSLPSDEVVSPVDFGKLLHDLARLIRTYVRNCSKRAAAHENSTRLSRKVLHECAIARKRFYATHKRASDQCDHITQRLESDQEISDLYVKEVQEILEFTKRIAWLAEERMAYRIDPTPCGHPEPHVPPTFQEIGEKLGEQCVGDLHRLAQEIKTRICGISEDEDDPFHPARWFGKLISDRLRKATQKNRKIKRVRYKMIEGAKYTRLRMHAQTGQVKYENNVVKREYASRLREYASRNQIRACSYPAEQPCFQHERKTAIHHNQ